jgi:hypothetical protein
MTTVQAALGEGGSTGSKESERSKSKSSPVSGRALIHPLRGFGAAVDLLSTNAVAKALGLGRERARLIMKRTPGVIVFPAVHGKGLRKTRRMPKPVLESLLVMYRERRKNPPV